ncbi:MAG: hypothetical protein JXR37_34045 [Kiritimatiellae bacterium]|nr:hypothetical protein [Kiritimatiellia bacterium]
MTTEQLQPARRATCVCAVLLSAVAAEAAVQAWDPGGVVPAAGNVWEADGWAAVSPASAAGYAFKQDAVVENRYVRVVLCAQGGKALLHSKPPGRHASLQLLFVPARGHGMPAAAAWRIREAAESRMVLEGNFGGSGSGAAPLQAVLVLRDTALEVRPEGGLAAVRLLQHMDYGLLPAIIGEDQSYEPAAWPAATRYLNLPAENLFLGLLPGEDRLLVCTWPRGAQTLRLALGNAPDNARVIAGLEATLAGKPFFLTLLTHPGIWHKETLDDRYLDTDVLSAWTKPFEASRWRVQGTMRGVPSSLEWRTRKGEVGLWGLEHVTCPAWFDGNKACFRLSKSISDKGAFLAYPLGPKGKNAPVDTPLDIMADALGQGERDSILDMAGEYRRGRGNVPGWKLSDGYPYVDGSYSCHVCPVLYAVFDAGREVEEKPFVQAILWDQSTLFATQRQRIMEFMELAWDLRKTCAELRRTQPKLAPVLAGIEETTAKMEALYEPQKTITDPTYWEQHDQAIMALTRQHAPENLAACVHHACLLHHVGVIQTHKLPVDLLRETRDLYTRAGYACVNTPDAVPVVEAIRKRIRECLRQPYWSQRGVGGR